VVCFLDFTTEDSEITPGSKYHDRIIFRVSSYQEIRYGEEKTKYRGQKWVNYINERRAIVRLIIHVPTVFGDFPIDRFVQEASTNSNSGKIERNISNPRYFPHTPSLEDWFARQQKLSDYKIDTYTAFQPYNIHIAKQPHDLLGRGIWRTKQIVYY
jgi:hypothetical protein